MQTSAAPKAKAKRRGFGYKVAGCPERGARRPVTDDEYKRIVRSGIRIRKKTEIVVDENGEIHFEAVVAGKSEPVPRPKMVLGVLEIMWEES